jgi:hypothetical protein
MNVIVIDSPKGRYFYFHVLPALRQSGALVQARMVSLEELKDKDQEELVLGDQVYADRSGPRFVAIDRFLTERASYSFSEEDVEELKSTLGRFLSPRPDELLSGKHDGEQER